MSTRPPILASIWLLGVVLAGCPPRETVIDITPTGAATLFNSCAGPPLDFETLCDMVTTACDATERETPALALCEDARRQCRELEAAHLAATCIVEDLKRPIANTSVPMAVQVALVTVEEGQPVVRDTSACVTIDYPCEGKIDNTCGSKGVNAALAEAIPPEGLGFDGLDDDADAVPIALLFHDVDADGQVSCTQPQLFACGALDQRLPGEDTRDLVCASCQFGAAATVESAPCVTPCFIDICSDLTLAIQGAVEAAVEAE